MWFILRDSKDSMYRGVITCYLSEVLCHHIQHHHTIQDAGSQLKHVVQTQAGDTRFTPPVSTFLDALFKSKPSAIHLNWADVCMHLKFVAFLCVKLRWSESCAVAYWFFCHRIASGAKCWMIHTLFITMNAACLEFPVIQCYCKFLQNLAH